MARRAVIVGGGLAGMTVAKELCKRGIQVVILEATGSLGGKAGGKVRRGNIRVEHGYHVFPAWYLNTRQLFRELDIDRNLIDIHVSHYLRKRKFPCFASFYELSSIRNGICTLFSGIRPWPEMILSYYYYADLASRRFKKRKRRSFLDRISASGFLYKRFYATEGVVEFNQQQTLQGTSTPIYEMSAMVLLNVVRYWAKSRKPFLSILNGNLQEKFIDPFEKHLRQLGVDIHYSKAVKKLKITNQRVAGIKLTDGSELEGTSPEDIFVLATPPEVTFQFYDDEVAAAEQTPPPARAQERSLSDLTHLRSMPMAGLTLYFNRHIPELPKEHVFLDGSRYKISFVDISQQWEDLKKQGNTVLSMIAADFAPLRGLSSTAMAERLIEELLAYIPTIRREDIERHYLEPNLSSPLFLNTVGAWHYRPGTRTRIGNLYITGDYCRTEADLTTMESAVLSGLSTAKDILSDQGMEADVAILPLKTYPRRRFVVLKYVLLPFVLLLRLLVRLKLVPHTSRQ